MSDDQSNRISIGLSKVNVVLGLSVVGGPSSKETSFVGLVRVHIVTNHSEFCGVGKRRVQDCSEKEPAAGTNNVKK